MESLDQIRIWDSFSPIPSCSLSKTWKISISCNCSVTQIRDSLKITTLSFGGIILWKVCTLDRDSVASLTLMVHSKNLKSLYALCHYILSFIKVSHLICLKRRFRFLFIIIFFIAGEFIELQHSNLSLHFLRKIMVWLEDR